MLSTHRNTFDNAPKSFLAQIPDKFQFVAILTFFIRNRLFIDTKIKFDKLHWLQDFAATILNFLAWPHDVGSRIACTTRTAGTRLNTRKALNIFYIL